MANSFSACMIAGGVLGIQIALWSISAKLGDILEELRKKDDG